MASPLRPHDGEVIGCPVCGDDSCTRSSTHPHHADYPFLPGGIDPMAQTPHVIAPHRIIDHDLQRVVYSIGDRVPHVDAVKYGLLPAEQPIEDAAPAKPRRKKRGPAEDRAVHGPNEDR